MNELIDDLNGVQKAAILLISLEAEISGEIFKYLDEGFVEKITREIIKMQNVHPRVTDLVTEEFYNMVSAQEYIFEGGVDYAKEILEIALGAKRAFEIISRVQSGIQMKGFNVLRNIDPNQLLSFIQKEHPQTIALVLSQIDRRQAASIISELPEKIQADVIFRIAKMDQVAPDLVKEVEEVLESRVDFSAIGKKIGGLKSVAEVLNMVGQSTEKSILNSLSQRDNELADAIKKLMFVFEDILLLGDRSVQQILSNVDNKDLAMALKAASDEVKMKVFSNMSERAASMLQEELEYLGPVKLKDVEDSQQKIIDIIRKLEEEGEIMIGGGSKGEEIIE